MKKILKYVLEDRDYNLITIPSKEILSVETQSEKVVVYALVDTEDMEEVEYEFRTYGTGRPIDIDTNLYVFLGTVKFLEKGWIVHVFYKPTSDEYELCDHDEDERYGYDNETMAVEYFIGKTVVLYYKGDNEDLQDTMPENELIFVQVIDVVGDVGLYVENEDGSKEIVSFNALSGWREILDKKE